MVQYIKENSYTSFSNYFCVSGVFYYVVYIKSLSNLIPSGSKCSLGTDEVYFGIPLLPLDAAKSNQKFYQGLISSSMFVLECA